MSSVPHSVEHTRGHGFDSRERGPPIVIFYFKNFCLENFGKNFRLACYTPKKVNNTVTLSYNIGVYEITNYENFHPRQKVIKEDYSAHVFDESRVKCNCRKSDESDNENIYSNTNIPLSTCLSNNATRKNFARLS